MRRTAFTRDGWSFRPTQYGSPHGDAWAIHEKGTRGGPRAVMWPASDGGTFIVTFHNVGGRVDARPSFEACAALAVERLNQVWRRTNG